MISGASLAYNTEEMSYALKTAQARFLMTTPRPMEVAAASAKGAGIPKQNAFLLEGELPGYITIQDLIRIGKSYGESGQRSNFHQEKRIKMCADSRVSVRERLVHQRLCVHQQFLDSGI